VCATRLFRRPCSGVRAPFDCCSVKVTFSSLHTVHVDHVSLAFHVMLSQLYMGDTPTADLASLPTSFNSLHFTLECTMHMHERDPSPACVIVFCILSLVALAGKHA
jgi:hypothetical protein